MSIPHWWTQITLNPPAPAIGSVKAPVLIPIPKFQFIFFPSIPISLGRETWPWTLNLWLSTTYLKKVQRIVHLGFITAMPIQIWLFHPGGQFHCISYLLAKLVPYTCDLLTWVKLPGPKIFLFLFCSVVFQGELSSLQCLSWNTRMFH